MPSIYEVKPPLYDFATMLGQYLQALLRGGNISAPPNPYRVDTPLSPTNQMWGRLSQQYSLSPAPEIMGWAAGTLGRFMNPNMNLDAEQRLGGRFAGRTPTDLFNRPSMSGLPGRQFGGPVDQDRPYMVGEAGPEVFVPSSSGTIVPTGPLPLPGRGVDPSGTLGGMPGQSGRYGGINPGGMYSTRTGPYEIPGRGVDPAGSFGGGGFTSPMNPGSGGPIGPQPAPGGGDPRAIPMPLPSYSYGGRRGQVDQARGRGGGGGVGYPSPYGRTGPFIPQISTYSALGQNTGGGGLWERLRMLIGGGPLDSDAMARYRMGIGGGGF